MDEVGFRIFGVCWVHTFFFTQHGIDIFFCDCFSTSYGFVFLLACKVHLVKIFIFELEYSTYHVPSSRAPQLMEIFHARSDGHVGWKF